MKTRGLTLSLLLLAIVIGAVLAFIGWNYKRANTAATINSFEGCAAAGYPILDSYPEQCRTPDGKSFTKIVAGQPITLSGEIVCLPHRQTEGPQTLECAYGIKTDNGTHYALRDPEMKFLGQLPTNERATITGTLITEQSNAMTIYNIVGIVQLTSVQK